MSSYLFDAHCHLQDVRFNEIRDDVIKEAIESGIKLFSVNAVCQNDWKNVKELSDKYPENIIPNYGIHPWYVEQESNDNDCISKLKEILLQNSNAGLGECGIDKIKKSTYNKQIELFKAQLMLSKELNRPVSIHCVRAFGDLIKIINDYAPFPNGIILHSWTGSSDITKSLLKYENIYYSLSGYTLNISQEKLEKLIKEIPLERMLVETDAPDGLTKEMVERLSSDQRRHNNNNINVPVNLKCIVKRISEILKIDVNALSNITFENTKNVFKNIL